MSFAGFSLQQQDTQQQQKQQQQHEHLSVRRRREEKLRRDSRGGERRNAKRVAGEDGAGDGIGEREPKRPKAQVVRDALGRQQRHMDDGNSNTVNLAGVDLIAAEQARRAQLKAKEERNALGMVGTVDRGYALDGIVLEDRADFFSKSKAARESRGSNFAGASIDKERDLQANDALPDDLAQFRADVEKRPDSADVETYARVPVNEFGAAMLRAMSWEPDRPLGRSSTVTKPVEYMRRPGRVGLGTSIHEMARVQAQINEEGGPGSGQEFTVVSGAEGAAKSVRRGDESVTRLCDVAASISVGKEVRITQGKHNGLAAEVRGISEGELGSRILTLTLRNSGSVLRIREADVAGGHPPAGAVTSSSLATGDLQQNRLLSSGRQAPMTSPSWLLPGLVVRIIDKTLDQGRLYLKKGEVIDTIGNSCTIRIEDSADNRSEGIGGRIVSDINDQVLETVIPRVALDPATAAISEDENSSRVRIVRGLHTGAVGAYCGKNPSRTRACVFLYDSSSVQEFELDEVCAARSS